MMNYFNEVSHQEMLEISFLCPGWPSSSVTWWREGQVLDTSWEEISPGKSRNTMKLERLARQSSPLSLVQVQPGFALIGWTLIIIFLQLLGQHSYAIKNHRRARSYPLGLWMPELVLYGTRELQH